MAEHPLCVCTASCDGHANPCNALATTVDHDDDTDYTTDRYNPERFRSLCQPCHAKRTARQGTAAQRGDG